MFKSYIPLIKPKPTSLAVFTTWTGFYIASESINFVLLIHTLIAAYLIGGGANAWNQLMERVFDAQMPRTQNRPLVTGKVTPKQVFWFALTLSLSGIFYLLIFTNIKAAYLGALILISYVLMYTPLKRKSPWCVYVGAISGALPPYMGWVAATNSFDIGGWILFGILFFWQIPHFLAIAWLYQGEYGSAGYKMPMSKDKATTEDLVMSVLCICGVIVCSMAPIAIGLAGLTYGLLNGVLLFIFIYSLIDFTILPSKNSARKVIKNSVFYLFFLMVLLIYYKPL